VAPAGRDFLLQEGTDQRYGARTFETRHRTPRVYPLANLLPPRGAPWRSGLAYVTRKQEQLTFVREGENLALPASPPEAVLPVRVRDGKERQSVDVPGTTTRGAFAPEWLAK